MKNWKRIVSIACVTALTVTLFAACGQTKNTGKFNILSEDLGSEEYGVGFRNGDIALGLAVQTAIDEISKDGTGKQISEKWFGQDILIKDADYKEQSAAPDSDQSLEKVKAKGELVLGLDDTFAPMGFRDDNNEISGFDIDLAREVCKRLGVELKLQPIDWDAKEMELNTGKIDCIWNGMSITPERIDSMFIAKAYIANRQIVIVPENSKIKTVADLEGKTVGLQKGSSSLDALNANPIKDKVKEVSQYADNVSAFMDLKAGRIDAFVVDEVAGRYMLNKDKQQ